MIAAGQKQDEGKRQQGMDERGDLHIRVGMGNTNIAQLDGILPGFCASLMQGASTRNKVNNQKLLCAVRIADFDMLIW